MKKELVLLTFLPVVLVAQRGEARKTPAVPRTALYAAVGPELTQYDLDRENGGHASR